MSEDSYSGDTEKLQDPRLANLKPFTKGISGNPKGKPPGAKNRSTIAKEFAAVVTGGLDINGNVNPNMTAEELMNAALWRKAFEGDLNAIKELQDTLYGKLTDKSEVSGAEGKELFPTAISINVVKPGA